MVHVAINGQNRAAGNARRQRRPVDLVFLARQTMGDRVLECDVLAMFDHQINAHMIRIRQAKDPGELANLLSALKGCALGVGASAIAELASEAEKALAANSARSDEAIDDVAMAVHEASVYVGDLLAG